MKQLTEKERNIVENIYTLNIHKAITVKAIQNLSFKGNQSAWNIRNSGYTDPITEELYSNTLIELINAVNDGLCTLEDNKLVFADTNEEENSETFLKIYRSISNYLYNQRQKENKWLYIEEVNEENESTYYSINDKKALSARSNMDSIEDMEIIKTVRNGLRKSDSDILSDLLHGLSYRDIAQKYNITLKAVRCAVDRIRKAYPKEKIKRLSDIKANWKDTTIHNYFTFDNKPCELSESMKEVYNRYLIIHNQFMKDSTNTEYTHTIIEDKQVIYPFTPAGQGLSDSEKKRKISISYEKKHTAHGQGDSYYKRPLLFDTLQDKPKTNAKPKAYKIEKKKTK